ncbi:MAG: PAS domain S-box protein [Candidatus Erginobacter occultus]|nr:PAS domain S-box protein [Candidatus Erginobacter occultus]
MNDKIKKSDSAQEPPVESGGSERSISFFRKRADRRKELLEVLREKYLQCSAIVDNLKDGIFVETVRGEILDVNAAAGRMLGYRREELLKMTVGDLVPPEVAAGLPDKIQDLTVQEGIYVETVNVRKDGSRVPVEVSNTLIKIGGKKRVIAVVHDISERIENRKKLIASHQELEEKVRRRTEELDRANRELRDEHRLFIGGPTVVIKWQAAPGWPVEYVSPNVEIQFGYPPGEFTGSGFLYESIIHPEDRERIAGEITERVAAGKNSYEQVYRIAHRSGEWRWVSDFTVVERNGGGDITHYHGYVLDITERKNTEEELKRHREHLEDLVGKRTAELTGMVDAMARRVVRTSDLEIAVERLKDRLREAGLDPGDGESPAPPPRP